ncbi:MAG: tetratricopeptide repeat protein, partial [Planctomycetota bacterium]|nr:tetratricopeptide repeat protein [Planctomycetota bacterium]
VAKSKAMAAYELMEQGDAKGAMVLLERARALQPRDSMIEMLYLDTAIRSGQMARAMAVMDELLALNPPPLAKDDPLFYIALEAADRCLQQRAFDTAREFVRRAAFIDPASPGPWAVLAGVYDAQALPAAAVLCLDRGLELDPDRADLRDFRSVLTRNQSLGPQ